MGTESAWWESANTEWTQGDPSKAVRLFAAVYSTKEQARYVVERIGLTEPDVGGGIEGYWRTVLSDAATHETSSAIDVAAYALFDAGAIDQRDPLIRLLGDRLPLAHALGTFRYGQAPAPPLGAVDTELLETITSRTAGVIDSQAYERAVIDHGRRTAKLLRPDYRGDLTDAGTGVLIGPNLLLTAAHVVDEELPPPGPVKMMAVFDYNSALGKSRADTGIRVLVTELVYGLPPTALELAKKAGLNADAEESELDFAVLKLARAVGDEPAGDPRGHYPVDDNPYPPGSGLRLWHHPADAFATVSTVEEPIIVSPSGNRLSYKTNTLPGSSGSPIVNPDGRLIAIHHAGLRTGNRGVPFSAISKALLNSSVAMLFTDPAPPAPAVSAQPFQAILVGGDPFVDREPLRDALRGMTALNGRRYLAISGEPDRGKTHSFVFLSHVAAQSPNSHELTQVAPGGLKAISVDLREYASLPIEDQLGEVGRHLLQAVGLVSAGDVTAQQPRHAISIANRLRTAIDGSDKQWWIGFDSIDHPEALRQTKLNELINAIASLTKDLQLHVRVVLSGEAVREFLKEPANNLPWHDHEIRMENITIDEGVAWIEARAAEVGQEVSSGDLREDLVAFVSGEFRRTMQATGKVDEIELASQVEEFKTFGLPPKEVRDLLPAFLERATEGGP